MSSLKFRRRNKLDNDGRKEKETSAMQTDCTADAESLRSYGRNCCAKLKSKKMRLWIKEEGGGVEEEYLCFPEAMGR